MKNFYWFKQIANNGSNKLERRLSLGEYKRAVSWSKYLVSSGAEIKGEGEEEWSADMSQLFIGNKFASGRHSRIYRGVYKQRDVAIKLISQPEEDGDLAAYLEKQFTSEVALLFRLHHPNILTFFAACKKPPVFCIITEYLAGGSLRKFLHQQEPYSVPFDLVLKLALDIARGMQYLHSQGILHRDLKSENLLLDEDMCVKVADFGISCLESQCGSAKGFTGTYRWMAPEMIKEKHHTKKVDVYSFGIVLWELLTALTPFDNMTPEQAAFAVCQKRCWSGNPGKRPHFKEIVTILEGYVESLEHDPDFFLSCKPAGYHRNKQKTNPQLQQAQAVPFNFSLVAIFPCTVTPSLESRSTLLKMPGLVVDEIHEEGLVDKLIENGSLTSFKENSVPSLSPNSTLSPKTPWASGIGYTANGVIDTSIDQLYDNVCEMQGSDQSPSRPSFGSEGEECRIDSGLNHLVRGKMGEVEIMEDGESKRGLWFPRGENPHIALELSLRAAKSFTKCATGKPSLDVVMCLHVTAAIYCNFGQYSEAIPVLKCSIEIPVIDEGQDQALAKFAGSMQLGDTYAMDLWWVILRTRYCVTKMV
ncbi:hypothetical protein LguiA_028124 [Lonicera macranthoides]